MKELVIFILAIMLVGCSPLQIKRGSKPLAKLNLGQTQVDIAGEYSGNIYTPHKGKQNLGRIHLGGTMRDLK